MPRLKTRARQSRALPARPRARGVLHRHTGQVDRRSRGIVELDEVVRVRGAGIASAAIQLGDNQPRLSTRSKDEEHRENKKGDARTNPRATLNGVQDNLLGHNVGNAKQQNQQAMPRRGVPGRKNLTYVRCSVYHNVISANVKNLPTPQSEFWPDQTTAFQSVFRA